MQFKLLLNTLAGKPSKLVTEDECVIDRLLSDIRSGTPLRKTRRERALAKTMGSAPHTGMKSCQKRVN